MSALDTVVALSSGSLPSGVAVVRISGPATAEAVVALAGDLPEPRRLSLRRLTLDDQHLDTGLVAWFPGPHSFTGEDAAEFQVHGSAAVVRALLRGLTRRPGVRLAGAGEFTRRAFENGALNLTEIEGLGDLIGAETESQRRQALARLEGGLTTQLVQWREMLLDLRAEIEARLDFSDEGDVGELPESFVARLGALRARLLEAVGSVERGRVVREGLRVALAGPPNAGKSSLLNALAKSDVAIVTDEAGTTRDVRDVPLDLGGQLVVLVDMAGLRDAVSKAEAEGVRRAQAEISRADLVLWLSAPDAAQVPMDTAAPLWRVATKSDLGAAGTVGAADHVVSSHTGEGIGALVEALESFAAGAVGDGEPALVSRERDRAALSAAAEALEEAGAQLANTELAAESLRRASHALERLLGGMDAELVLDRLFTGFCIGK